MKNGKIVAILLIIISILVMLVYMPPAIIPAIVSLLLWSGIELSHK